MVLRTTFLDPADQTGLINHPAYAGRNAWVLPDRGGRTRNKHWKSSGALEQGYDGTDPNQSRSWRGTVA